MDIIWLSLGILLYLAVAMDILKTTLSLQGAGWFTSNLCHGFWQVFLKLNGGNGRARTLDHAGYILLILIIGCWVIGLWVSFFLLLLSETYSIVDSGTRLPADAWQKLYYAGFTVSTLGVGDYIGSQNVWRLLTNVYAFTGLILITMSITYFVQVLSGAILQRNLAITLSSLGQSPQQIVLNSWNGQNFQRLVAQVSNLSNMLIMHSQNHKAFPVEHFFHTYKAKYAITPRIAALFDALVILTQYVNKDLQPDQHDLSPLHTALQNYFEVIIEIAHQKKEDDVPPKPNLEKLIEKELIDIQASEISLKDHVQNNRKLLLGLVKYDGWTWEDVDPD